jgi:hypothetical protein
VIWNSGATPSTESSAVKPIQSRYVWELNTAAITAGDLTVNHRRDAGKAIATMCTALAQWFQPDGRTIPEQIAKEYAQFALRLLGYPLARIS